jgi:hypothetical protein
LIPPKKINANKYISNRIVKITDLMKTIIADQEASAKATNDKIDLLMNEVLSLEENHDNDTLAVIPKRVIPRMISMNFNKIMEEENEHKLGNLRSENDNFRFSSSNIHYSLRNVFQTNKFKLSSQSHQSFDVSDSTPPKFIPALSPTSPHLSRSQPSSPHISKKTATPTTTVSTTSPTQPTTNVTSVSPPITLISPALSTSQPSSPVSRQSKHTSRNELSHTVSF